MSNELRFCSQCCDSYACGCAGPCLATHTACSSSLVATHLAAGGLANSECDAAVAAGVFMVLLGGTMAGICQLQVLSLLSFFSAESWLYGLPSPFSMLIRRSTYPY